MMGSSSRPTTSTSTLSDVPPSVELRASVLDAAISIGFRNSVMAKWMFDPNTGVDADGSPPDVSVHFLFKLARGLEGTLLCVLVLRVRDRVFGASELRRTRARTSAPQLLLMSI